GRRELRPPSTEGAGLETASRRVDHGGAQTEEALLDELRPRLGEQLLIGRVGISENFARGHLNRREPFAQVFDLGELRLGVSPLVASATPRTVRLEPLHEPFEPVALLDGEAEEPPVPVEKRDALDLLPRLGAEDGLR